MKSGISSGSAGRKEERRKMLELSHFGELAAFHDMNFTIHKRSFLYDSRVD